MTDPSPVSPHSPLHPHPHHHIPSILQLPLLHLTTIDHLLILHRILGHSHRPSVDLLRLLHQRCVWGVWTGEVKGATRLVFSWSNSCMLNK